MSAPAHPSAVTFTAGLGSEVLINVRGVVKARTESVDRGRTYLVEYRSQGGVHRDWIPEHQLQEIVAHG